MPDWFYRTLAQRLLFALPGNLGRGIALGTIGFLGRSRAGRSIIELMGHMTPDPRLAVEVDGIRFASRIGLGWRVDPQRRASEALAGFGIGALEIREDDDFDVRRESNTLVDFAASLRSVSALRGLPIPVLRRRWTSDGTEEVFWPSGHSFPVKAWDQSSLPSEILGCAGVVLQVGNRTGAGAWQIPSYASEAVYKQVRQWRAVLGNSIPLVVAGAVSGPEQALALVDAGADIILVDAGLVFAGPGLIKRCNEALLREKIRPRSSPGNAPVVAPPVQPLFKLAWPWAAALGAALLLGGLLTLGLALTRVLLPYDEQYLGLTADLFRLSRPRLFAFMAHDRATLAGTMIGLGWLYTTISIGGIRRGLHGLKTAVVASALTGFASFFAFFGFGYFDTLHAFVAAILFQLTVQILAGSTGDAKESLPAIDREDTTWRRAQWGQLCWIIHAVGLLMAGITILGIGMTSVLVREDLNFLCISVEQALALGAKMTGVVAHDRATLGGMLLASGVGMLLPCLWSYRRGQRWLWVAIAGLGLPSYSAAIGVHLWVGYVDWHHLVPAFAGLLLWSIGLGLSRAYLYDPED